ncbi:hypothetical protein Peur_057139 [Populus x canadensis]
MSFALFFTLETWGCFLGIWLTMGTSRVGLFSCCSSLFCLVYFGCVFARQVSFCFQFLIFLSRFLSFSCQRYLISISLPDL